MCFLFGVLQTIQNKMIYDLATFGTCTASSSSRERGAKQQKSAILFENALKPIQSLGEGLDT